MMSDKRVGAAAPTLCAASIFSSYQKKGKYLLSARCDTSLFQLYSDGSFSKIPRRVPTITITPGLMESDFLGGGVPINAAA